MIDLDELAAAGIADAHGRRPLLEYLDSLGFSAEEMVEAEREGRLFALAGDAQMRSGRRVTACGPSRRRSVARWPTSSTPGPRSASR